MHKYIQGFFYICVFLLVGFVATGCSGDEDPLLPEPVWRVEPTAGFRARQAAFLQHCADQHGPGKGGRHGQVCLVATGASAYNREALQERYAKITARRDTSDFDLTSLLRMLYLHQDTGALPEDIRQDIEDVVLRFKYWLDEPGPDTMVWWSENHQILFASLEYLAGHLYPDSVFTNSGMTGREHVEHALPWLERWLLNRVRFGFSEFHSNVYFDEDMPALINLVDFAPDEAIRARAAMVLDLMAIDMASNYYQGRFATAHGRTYPSRLLGGLGDSTREATWLLMGLGPVEDVSEVGNGGFTGSFLATSQHYAPPPILEAYARATEDNLEHRQRDSINVSEGPEWGISYDAWHDVIFWWGMTGYIAPDIIDGSFRMVDNFNMWEGETWQDLKFLKAVVDTSVPARVADEFAVMAQGIVLEQANTYVYRTPGFQLAGVQDYKPGFWTGQVHAWKATLTPDAYVFTTYPGGSSGDYMGGEWTGGFVPRATLDRAVGIIQYRRPPLPEVAERLLGFVEDAGFGLDFVEYSHAYFPRDEFDEVVTGAGWTIARIDQAYVGLWSENPTTWATDNRYELIADSRENVWITELGRQETHGSFAAFAGKLMGANVAVIDQVVHYSSPYQGDYQVGWTGPFRHEGMDIDLGPYRRWDNPYVQQEFGTRTTVLSVGEQELTLDFDGLVRR